MMPRPLRTLPSGTLAVLLLSLFLLSSSAVSQLVYRDSDDEVTEEIPLKILTQEDGAAADELVLEFETPEGHIYQGTQFSSESNGIITGTSIEDPELGGGRRNISILLEFEGDVGDEAFTVTTTTVSDPEGENTEEQFTISGSYRIVGIALRGPGGAVASGVGGTFMTSGAEVGEGGFYEFDVNTWGPNGEPIDPNTFDIVIRAPGNEVSYDEGVCAPLNNDGPTEQCGVGFSDGGGKFFVAINDDAVASNEPVKINFRNPTIIDEMTGMEFQQELNIVVDEVDAETAALQCPVIEADRFGGEFFDIPGVGEYPEAPLGGSLPVGSSIWSLSVENSVFQGDAITLSFDTQPIEESTAVIGTGTMQVTEEETIDLPVGDGGDCEVAVSSDELAEIGEFDPDTASQFSWYVLRVRLDAYTPGTFSQHKNMQIIAELERTVQLNSDDKRIILEAVEPLSATQRLVVYPWDSARQEGGGVVAQYGVLFGDDATAANDSTVEYIQSGTFANDIHMRPGNVALAEMPRLFAAPAETPTPVEEDEDGGFPVWATVVIGVAAALLGLLLIGCCLFFFLGRDRDEDASTEPSFTVEGPASVPVPVEYPVVRDAFGRGHYETELGSGEVDPAAGLPVEHPRINSSL